MRPHNARAHARAQAAGNAQYMYMGVAMVQFFKAFTPMVVAMVTRVLLKRVEPAKVWAALISLSFAGTEDLGTLPAEPISPQLCSSKVRTRERALQ